jgi:hypothetical protein
MKKVQLGDISKDLTKCTYYNSGVFDFMLNGGPCWGLCRLTRESGYRSDPNYYLASENWIDEEWRCEGHKDYPWSYLVSKKYRLVEIDEEFDDSNN